jgi:hypothetical protein
MESLNDNSNDILEIILFNIFLKILLKLLLIIVCLIIQFLKNIFYIYVIKSENISDNIHIIIFFCSINFKKKYSYLSINRYDEQ